MLKMHIKIAPSGMEPSIFGVKKKQVDISKIKKKVKDMDNLYKYIFFEMYENFNNLNFKILEIENSLKK